MLHWDWERTRISVCLNFFDAGNKWISRHKFSHIGRWGEPNCSIFLASLSGHSTRRKKSVRKILMLARRAELWEWGARKVTQPCGGQTALFPSLESLLYVRLTPRVPRGAHTSIFFPRIFFFFWLAWRTSSKRRDCSQSILRNNFFLWISRAIQRFTGFAQQWDVNFDNIVS